MLLHLSELTFLYFSEDEVQRASRYMKTFSDSLVAKEMQMKTTVRLCLTPVRTGYIR